MKKETGGPAFPIEAPSVPEFDGMSLRDYFAAKAMQANLTTRREFPDETWRTGLALEYYAMADAMLA